MSENEKRADGLRRAASRALMGMQRCMPATAREDLGCGDCPYRADCFFEQETGTFARMFPERMLNDIRLVLEETAKL